MDFLGWVIIAGCVAIPVVAVIRTAMVMNRGVQTMATIVSARGLGSTSGDVPDVLFTLEFTDPQTGEKHRVVTRDAVSPIYTPSLQPGMIAPVKFLRNNPQRIMFVYSEILG